MFQVVHETDIYPSHTIDYSVYLFEVNSLALKVTYILLTKICNIHTA